MSGFLEVAIPTLVAASSACAAIFIEICGHCMTRLSFTRPSGRSRRYAGVLHDTFTIFGGNKLHLFLILGKNFLWEFCSACDWWYRYSLLCHIHGPGHSP